MGATSDTIHDAAAGWTVRPARASDAPGLVEIYRPFVERTTVTFEETAPDAAEFVARIEKSRAAHEWLVAEDERGLLGYAYGTTHRAREAYRFTVEVSAYLAERARGRGLGGVLYDALFERLVALGYRNAVAGVTMPNDPSVRFHERMGFTPVGVFRRIGFKFGRWCDVAWFERPLGRARAGAVDESP